MWRIHGKKHLPYENTFPTPNSYFAEAAQKLFFINMAIAIMTFILVMFLLGNIILRYTYFNTSLQSCAYYDIEENWIVESLFVLYPFCIVMLLMGPSFSVLYSLAEIHEPEMIIKIIGHQWYWSYEVTATYSLFNN
jgi:cytochrome c oxidase subunit 2